MNGGYTSGLPRLIYTNRQASLPGKTSFLTVRRSIVILFSSSALTQSNWRSHTTVVHSLPLRENNDDVLSRVVHPTGLHEVPSTHILPFHSDTVFHPNEMLYAVAGPDGTIRLMGCKLHARREQSYTGILRPYDVVPPERSTLDVNGFHNTNSLPFI